MQVAAGERRFHRRGGTSYWLSPAVGYPLNYRTPQAVTQLGMWHELTNFLIRQVFIVWGPLYMYIKYLYHILVILKTIQ